MHLCSSHCTPACVNTLDIMQHSCSWALLLLACAGAGGKTEDFISAAKLFYRAKRQVKVPTYLVPATQKVGVAGWHPGNGQLARVGECVGQRLMLEVGSPGVRGKGTAGCHSFFCVQQKWIQAPTLG